MSESRLRHHILCDSLFYDPGRNRCFWLCPAGLFRENPINRERDNADCRTSMPRTHDEELGRRRFQLVKEQAVEDAVAKIRHAPAAGWDSFSMADYSLLREILGELWIRIGRERWEQYSFSTLTRQDILTLLALGAGMKDGTLTGETLGKMDEILSHSKNKSPEA